VTWPAPIVLHDDVDGPHVRLLDAERAGVDEYGLRAWANEETAAAGAPYASRSYRHPYALVAWHAEPVGVDIERIEPVKEAFLESICTPREMTSIRTSHDVCDAGSASVERYVASLWCSKEALSKALGDPIRYDPRRLGSPIFWPGGRSGPWHAASLDVPRGHHGWLCWRSSSRGS
jgi:4'-phosphopantetheinyl transferase superfamily